MKKMFQKIVTLLVMLVIGVSNILSLGVLKVEKASGLDSEYYGQNNTIYYFTDFYPTIDKRVMEHEFGGYYSIVYDHKYVNSTIFDNMVYNDYFQGFGDNCMVIIDIKTFMPDPTTLYDLFYKLREDGCVTVFVSYYPESSYSDDSFLENVNIFKEDTQLDRLCTFINESFDDLILNNDTLDYTTFFIDAALINSTFGWEMENLYNNSLFLQVFLNELGNRLGITYESLTELIDKMNTEWHIRIMVKKTYNDNIFVNILSGEEQRLSNLGQGSTEMYSVDFIESIAIGTEETGNAAAFGFWQLGDDYYSFMYEMQYQSFYNIPVYLLIVDDITYDPNGLIIASDIEFDDNDLDQIGQELLDEIGNFLN